VADCFTFVLFLDVIQRRICVLPTFMRCFEIKGKWWRVYGTRAEELKRAEDWVDLSCLRLKGLMFFNILTRKGWYTKVQFSRVSKEGSFVKLHETRKSCPLPSSNSAGITFHSCFLISYLTLNTYLILLSLFFILVSNQTYRPRSSSSLPNHHHSVHICVGTSRGFIVRETVAQSQNYHLKCLCLVPLPASRNSRLRIRSWVRGA
jgi:hypothetical protein